MQNEKHILDLLNSSYSTYHVVENIKNELLNNGFIQLFEEDKFDIKPLGKYFVIRNDSSIIAFKVPKTIKNTTKFLITATHNDSPTFKLKPNPIIKTSNLIRLDCEPYGGAIYSTWLDKPLSLAGRVFYLKDKKVFQKLVNIDKNLLIIPNLAIHMNRDVNSSSSFNPAVDMLPIMGEYFNNNNDSFDFNTYLISQLKLSNSTVLSHDLFLYNREKATFLGVNDEFISSSRVDDLSSTYSTLLGFISNDKNDNFAVFSSFDNEEVGSLTRQGAQSTFLKDILFRIYLALKKNYEDFLCAISQSIVLSIDNAHANHPSFLNLSDVNTNVMLNKGIVIKYNANQHYTTDASSSAFLKSIFLNNKLNYQEFTNRSDLKGGSTLGNLLQSQLSLKTVDIGIAQLAMHSSYETFGRHDLNDMILLTKSFFSK